MANIHSKTVTISNGDDIDADPVEQVHSELYENDQLMNDDINQLKTQIGGTSITANTISEATAGRGVSTDDVLLQDGMARLISIRAVISSTTTGSAVLTTGTAHGLTTGEAVKYATAAGVTPDTGLSSSTIYYARSLTGTTFSYHPTATDATNNTNPVTVTLATTGRKFLIAAPLTVPTDGKIWTDATGVHVALGGSIQDIPVSVYSLLTRFSGTKKPIYINATTFSVDRISERDSGNNVTITKSTSTTVDITTTGINGIAQSANLTGTVTVISGSTSVTFSASQTGALIPNDILTTAGGQSRKIVSISGTTATVESQFISTETTVAFKRGGRASFYTANTSGTVGTAHYYLYAITNGSTAGLILSTRCVAKGESLVDLPSGYSFNKTMPFAVTLYNTSTAAGVYTGNIIPFRVGPGWPYIPLILLGVSMTIYDGSTVVTGDSNIVSNGQNTSFTGVSGSDFIPAISRSAYLSAFCTAGSTFIGHNIRSAGTTAIQMACLGFGSYKIEGYCNVDTSQSIEYIRIGSGGLYLDVKGYVVTETF